ncbi:hypothetical protein [Dorea amylophila]|uniref:hypothetical protein n=1 Tax=Dorea amylophila TaxID=2981789 RepID=UPI0022E2D8ED|nr:hypothetical protein [Dorea amylophila]
MNKQEWTLEIADTFINFLEGSKNPVQLMQIAKEGIYDIKNMLFVHNLEAFVKGVEENGTNARKIGEMLAKSDYGAEYGYAFLKLIDSYETCDKGRALAMITDSMTKGFISPNDAFRYGGLIRDISHSSLLFLKNNVKKGVLYKTSSEEKIYINELLRYDLMYISENNGYAFDKQAFYIDKFGLSYLEEGKYLYSEKDGGIPPIEKFPKVPVSIVSEGVPYEE